MYILYTASQDCLAFNITLFSFIQLACEYLHVCSTEFNYMLDTLILHVQKIQNCQCSTMYITHV